MPKYNPSVFAVAAGQDISYLCRFVTFCGEEKAAVLQKREHRILKKS